jgi:hypothetical protein
VVDHPRELIRFGAQALRTGARQDLFADLGDELFQFRGIQR